MENSQPVAHGKPTDRDRILGAISYIGPLFVVSYLMAEHSRFVKFHAVQGLVFFLTVLVVRYGLGALVTAIFMTGITGFILSVINIALLALAIVAIIKAVQGEQWGMPVIGAWAKKLKV